MRYILVGVKFFDICCNLTVSRKHCKKDSPNLNSVPEFHFCILVHEQSGTFTSHVGNLFDYAANQCYFQEVLHPWRIFTQLQTTSPTRETRAKTISILKR